MGSEGSFGSGVDEVGDVHAAVGLVRQDAPEPTLVVGWSFGASVAQDFPLSLSGLYRRRGTRADDGFSGGKTTIHEIKRQRHEMNDFGHECPTFA